MLPADQIELLTAAVDGELTPRQARRLRRLLAASDEARTLFGRVQADAARLRNLPKATPPADLPERIMAKVAAAPPPVLATPAQPASVPFRRARTWVPVAVAASLLIGVTVSSFLFFARTTGGRVGVVANSGGEQPKQGPVVVITPETANALPSEHERLPAGPVANEPPAPRVVARNDASPSTAPQPRPKFDTGPRQPANLVGAQPLPDLPPFDRVQVRLPPLFAASELDRDDVRAALVEELGREHAYQINLFVKDPSRAAELLQAAARSVGLAVHADAAAADRIKTRKPTTAFVLFTESLTPTEVRNLLSRVATDDAKASARVFDTIHVTPLHPADQRDLHSVLGFDVNPAKKASNDPRSISSGTADQVAKNVGGRGGEKSAVLASYLPSNLRTPPTMSRALTQFVNARGERKPNAIAAVIVVRHAGN
jgi:hypothetical protein